MAQLLMCDVCRESPAVLLLTILDGGDVTAICGLCAPLNLRTVADLLSGEPIGEATAAPIDQPGGDTDEGSEAPPAGPFPKASKGRGAATPPTPAAQPEAQPAPAAQ